MAMTTRHAGIRALRAWLAVLTVGALLATTVPAGGIEASPTATFDRGIAAACAEVGSFDAGFPDVDGLAPATREAITCLAFYEITAGTADGRYDPSATISRVDMAVFLARLLAYAEEASEALTLPEPGPAPFGDVAALSAERREAVALLADTRITGGTASGDFEPFGPVTRRDMASFLHRAQALIDGDTGSYDTDETFFPDVPDSLPRADDVNALAAQGIVRGGLDGTYGPFEPVLRSQMALFLMRHVDENVDAGRLDAKGVADDRRDEDESAAEEDPVEDDDREEDDRRLEGEPEVDLLDSDVDGLTATVTFPPPRLREVEADGQAYHQVAVPGIPLGAEPAGQPAVPTQSLLVAVPQGAEVSVRARPSVAERHEDVLVLPGRHEPADAHHEDNPDFANPPFTRDEGIYRADEPYPREAATARVVGTHRDLTLAQVVVAAGRHNPVGRTYEAYDEVTVEVAFSGGAEGFVSERALSPFEPASRLALDLPINADAVTANVLVDPPFRSLCLGEELLVLTHPDFAGPASDLADWKNEKGLMTNVVEVGPLTDSPTVDDIREVIASRYDNCLVRPSYLLLLGGTWHIPVTRVETWQERDDLSETIATDLPYGHLDPPDFDANADDAEQLARLVPDFITGRIPADSLSEAETAVEKIIAYESAPPTEAGFYERTTHAAEFECCRTDLVETVGSVGAGEPDFTPGVSDRTFIESSEHIRNAATAFGYDAERVYTRTTSWDYNALGIDDTPLAYYDETPLPQPLSPAEGFAWDGTTSDVIDAFEDGRFLVTHRDHGASWGWSAPSFTANQVGSVTNGGRLPVIWSINCSTGQFDATGNSFAEAALFNPDGGGIAVIAASGLSPSVHNSRLARAMSDTIWPTQNPGLNPVSLLVTADPRVGDTLHAARLAMLALVEADGATAGYVRDQYLMYHVIGDPTLQMWTQQPEQPLPEAFTIELLDTETLVGYEVEGATVTLWQRVDDGSVAPRGRGVVEDGEARIEFESEPRSGQALRVSVDADDRVPRELRASRVP